LATISPIPEGTTCDYCAALATLTNGYYEVYCCYHHGRIWNDLPYTEDIEWTKLAMLVMVAEEASGQSSTVSLPCS